MRTLRARLLIGTALGTGLILSAFALALYMVVHAALWAEFDEALTSKARALAALVEQDGTNYIDYVYVRWTDAADRGLSYEIQLNTDLESGIWTNDTSKYVILPGGPVGADFWAVTNRIDTTSDASLSIRTDVSVTFGP